MAVNVLNSPLTTKPFVAVHVAFLPPLGLGNDGPGCGLSYLQAIKP